MVAASLYQKKVGGNTYWYLREMARVDGRPKMVSERYLGTAADIEAAVNGAVAVPRATRHLAFGAVAAGWATLQRLAMIEIIDEVVGPRRADAGASVGAYLALAALNRLVDPCSKLSFAEWWATTAADRFTRIRPGVLEHRRAWDATRPVTATHLAEIEQRITARMIDEFNLTYGRSGAGNGHQPRRVPGLRVSTSPRRWACCLQTTPRASWLRSSSRLWNRRGPRRPSMYSKIAFPPPHGPSRTCGRPTRCSW